MRLQILKGIAIGAAGILTVATTASYAQDQNQQDWNACACAGAAAAARDRVEACTRILGRDIPQMQAFALIHRGRAWVRKGDFDRALADFTAAIKEDADIVYGYADRGDVYRLRGQCEEAIADYDYALRLAPDRADIYLSRGICQTEQRRSDSAAINFDMAVRLDPSNAAGVAALALTRKADIAAMKGDFARALPDYDRAIALQPEDLAPYENRAIARFYFGDYRAAAEDLTRAVAGPPNPYAALWLHLSRACSGIKQNSAELARAALRLGPADWPYPIIELFQGGRAPESVQAAALSPAQQCEAHFYVGQWQLARGARDPAAQAFRQAVDACSDAVVEYRAALEELKRLKP